MNYASRLFVYCVSALATAAAVIPDASANEEPQAAIAPQALGDALEEWAIRNGKQLMFDADLAAGKRTQGVAAGVSGMEALAQLLEGTGLIYRVLNEKTVSIFPKKIEPVSGQNRASSAIGADMSLAQAADSEPDRGQEQEPAPMGRGERDDKATLEEIVVTAQKRQERLIDTPQAVSVLQADMLAKLGATQFRDFANSVPGLNFTTAGAGYNQLSLRGVTTGIDVSATVGTYVDEVPYGSSSGFATGAQLGLDMGLFDVDRIEVLRGPQGTLYGASAMGGLLKYVTKRPDSARFRADVQTGISATQDGGVSYNGSLAINTPLITQKAALRVSSFFSRDGGFTDNVTLGNKDVNAADVYGGRADMLLTPNEKLSVRFTAFLQNIARNGESSADFAFSGAPISGDLNQTRSLDEPFDQRFRLVSGTLAYDFGPATLTSISSYQTVDTTYHADVSLIDLPFCAVSAAGACSAIAWEFKPSTDKFTQEVRLASSGNNTLEWLFGGFYTHESSTRSLGFELRDVAGQPIPNDVLQGSFPSRFAEYAAFGDLTWHFTNRLDMTAGLRYAHNSQDFAQLLSFGVFHFDQPQTPSSEEVVTYLANARYRFNDHSTGYVRYATGYRPGGPNFVVPDPDTGQPVGNPTFAADKLKSYELGYRAESFDRRFGIDAAVYYIDWSDLQVLVNVKNFSGYDNAASGARVRGAELAVTARPISSFTMNCALAYQNAQMAKDEPNLGAREGDRLPNVPRLTASLNADWKIPVGSLQPTIGATVRHVGSRNASFDVSPPANPQFFLPAYTSIDLRTGIEINSVSLQLYAHNLFDRRGELSAYTFYGSSRVTMLQPRTIGITVAAHF